MSSIKWYSLRQDLYMDLPKNTVGAEIGVAKGLNAINLAQIAKPKKLYLVDTWEIYHMGPQMLNKEMEKTGNPYIGKLGHKTYIDHLSDLFEIEISNDIVKLCKMDAMDWLKSQKDDSLDWIYIDASHHYNDVKNQIEECKRVVKCNGLICGHDFGVNRDSWGLGPIAAIIENIQEGSLEMLGLTLEGFSSYMCRLKKH